MNNYKKFTKHLKTNNLFYAIWRGIKYFIFVIKWKGKYFESLSENMIVKGNIKMYCSNGGINIFWKDKKITSDPGLNVAVNTLGLWTDSSKAEWQILKRDDDFLNVKIVFKELPMEQIWFLKINSDNEIDWRVQANVEEWTHIDEFRVLTMVNSYYKIWLSDYHYADFPRLDDYWYDIYLNNKPVSLVGVRFSKGDNFLPPLVIGSQEENLLPLIQNPPLINNAHIVGVRINKLNDTNNFEPGNYEVFSGKIVLFEEESQLDKKIENIRQGYLKTVTSKSKLGEVS